MEENMKLSSIWSDGIVLQRNKCIHLFGQSESSKVEIQFAGQSFETSVSGNDWDIILPPMSAGGPYNMQIFDGEMNIIKDIFIGDVWILGGQSNMELPVSRVMDCLAKEVIGAEDSRIRMFKVPQNYNFNDCEEYINEGSWVSVNAESIMNFSAVGYFFARELIKFTKVPIGLIHTAVGGTPVEAWMSEDTLHKFGRYEKELAQNKDNQYIDDTINTETKEQQLWFSHLAEMDEGLKDIKWFEPSVNDADWSIMELPSRWYGTELENIRGSVWFRKDFIVPEEWVDKEIKLFLGTLVDGDDTYINGIHVGNTGYQYPPRRYSIPSGVLHSGRNNITVRIFSNANVGGFIPDKPYYLEYKSDKVELSGPWRYRIGGVTTDLKPQTFFQYKPSGLYQGMLHPLRRISITGVAFYQGESNTKYPEYYEELFKAMIQDWRELFGQGEFSFLFVQLSNFGDGKKTESGTNWAVLREAQRRTLSIKNTAMVVTLDVGEYNDLHPQNKKDVGIRLAYAAKKMSYDQNIIYSGPLFKEAKLEEDGEDRKIRIYFEHVGSGLISKNGSLRQFRIIDMEGRKRLVIAGIENDTVVIPLEIEATPVKISYAWENNPEGANLYNLEGFPASSFEVTI